MLPESTTAFPQPKIVGKGLPAARTNAAATTETARSIRSGRLPVFIFCTVISAPQKQRRAGADCHCQPKRRIAIVARLGRIRFVRLRRIYSRSVLFCGEAQFQNIRHFLLCGFSAERCVPFGIAVEYPAPFQRVPPRWIRRQVPFQFRQGRLPTSIRRSVSRFHPSTGIPTGRRTRFLPLRQFRISEGNGRYSPP